MTAIQCLKILKNGFLILILWNILLTGFLLFQFNQKEQEKINTQICNLEAIPQNNSTVPEFEIMEIE